MILLLDTDELSRYKPPPTTVCSQAALALSGPVVYTLRPSLVLA